MSSAPVMRSPDDLDTSRSCSHLSGATFNAEVDVSATYAPAAPSDKRILPAALLCFFFGVFGAHRFYVGKIGTAFLQLFTLGGCGIWAMIDFILIVTGSFRDEDDQKITDWT
jgi:TM2 domain-containing membrane protein YozV